MAHPNAEKYRRLTDAFRDGDAGVLRDALAEDVRWHEAGNPDMLEGRDAVMERMSGAADVQGKLDVRTVLADDEHVVAWLDVALSKPDGSSVAYPVVEVARMRDGQVVERWAYMDACPDDVTQFFASF